MVRVYISVDMEGVAGISHANPTRRGDYGYAEAVALMVGEANAAIEGAFDGGATAVTVNDSHGGMYNLAPEALDRRARVVLGKKPLSMNEAIADANLDVALFVGYHARAGHPTGVISHTYNPRALLVEVDGRPITEAGINALYLGAFGVPVAMVTGDDALAAELDDWLPWAETVVVKRAIWTRRQFGPPRACPRHDPRRRAPLRRARARRRQQPPAADHGAADRPAHRVHDAGPGRLRRGHAWLRPDRGSFGRLRSRRRGDALPGVDLCREDGPSRGRLKWKAPSRARFRPAATLAS